MLLQADRRLSHVVCVVNHEIHEDSSGTGTHARFSEFPKGRVKYTSTVELSYRAV